ncbi:cytochrome C oxidase subunit II [Natrinema saccharevitans]|uniref:Cytochrome C oxidase subunit II n=1 Tax=Natrinema saccharevitans TaxID=301967 RepID=A0A1S8AV60_9EURY|nr:cytochrome c oxidase subunit II [Natrinema saccharevitans]OLZ40477.1 cytochrome C oxidase subunit II [Natrinema saccharevitans]
MRIHTYEKLWLVGSMVLIVGFIVTITYGSVGLGISMIDDEDENVAPTELNDDERFGEPRVEQVGDDEYAAYVVAQTFVFQPDPIEVPANSEVTFHVTSRDVIHGFYVPGTNLNAMAIPGQVAEMSVEFDEPGEYGLICHEYCGSAHHDMEGLIVAQSENEFDLTDLSVEAPDEVAPGETIELTATVENGQFEPLETTVDAELGNETFQQNVTVDGESSENVTFTSESDTLGEGEHDWSVSVEDYEETGSVEIEGNESAEGDES